MSTEQAVAADADAQSQSGTEATGAQDGLDAALKEFDGATTQATETRDTTTPTTETPKTELAPEDAEFLRQERTRRANEVYQRDMADAVKTVKGEIDVDDELAEGWLHARANKDARLVTAFAQRFQKPDAWKAVLKSLGNEFARKFADQPDAGATEDRNAVRAAVRGASTRAPEAPAVDSRKLNQMSDREFEAYKRSLGA